ncbi:hypothetical protein V1478_005997 [Vespula squamosa]|uniref:Uncharacterized protein n=1 Tax=Vespula squamosa TaxID=30214 RepID=A0ABD2B900_VESSQ
MTTTTKTGGQEGGRWRRRAAISDPGARHWIGMRGRGERQTTTTMRMTDEETRVWSRDRRVGAETDSLPITGSHTLPTISSHEFTLPRVRLEDFNQRKISFLAKNVSRIQKICISQDKT